VWRRTQFCEFLQHKFSRGWVRGLVYLWGVRQIAELCSCVTCIILYLSCNSLDNLKSPHNQISTVIRLILDIYSCYFSDMPELCKEFSLCSWFMNALTLCHLNIIFSVPDDSTESTSDGLQFCQDWHKFTFLHLQSVLSQSAVFQSTVSCCMPLHLAWKCACFNYCTILEFECVENGYHN